MAQSHNNVLTFFPPDWGMLRRSRCIQIFLLKYYAVYYMVLELLCCTVYLVVRVTTGAAFSNENNPVK